MYSIPFIIDLPLAARALLGDLRRPAECVSAMAPSLELRHRDSAVPRQRSIMSLPKPLLACCSWNAAGREKRLARWSDRFANVLNFRGEPSVLGSDSLVSSSDAR
jgi:hypothetical protein